MRFLRPPGDRSPPRDYPDRNGSLFHFPAAPSNMQIFYFPLYLLYRYIYRKRDISWYRKRFDPFSFLLLVILWIRARIRSFLEALYIKINSNLYFHHLFFRRVVNHERRPLKSVAKLRCQINRGCVSPISRDLAFSKLFPSLEEGLSYAFTRWIKTEEYFTSLSSSNIWNLDKPGLYTYIYII